MSLEKIFKPQATEALRGTVNERIVYVLNPALDEVQRAVRSSDRTIAFESEQWAAMAERQGLQNIQAATEGQYPAQEVAQVQQYDQYDQVTQAPQNQALTPQPSQLELDARQQLEAAYYQDAQAPATYPQPQPMPSRSEYELAR